jgi:hypothetical protein
MCIRLMENKFYNLGLQLTIPKSKQNKEKMN